MTKRRQFDLIVIGAEPAGFAAAGCAAREGARTALIRTGDKSLREASMPGVPDFVWRKLNLQDMGLDAKPVGARVSLFEGGRSFKTYQSERKTHDALEAAGIADHHLWADFSGQLVRLREEGETLTQRASAPAGRNSAPALLGALAKEDGASAAERMTSTSAALLEDYFVNGDLKTHLASAALGPFGLGGDEAGSALALASLTAPAAWRMRASAKGPSLERVLEEAASAAGVEIIDARIRGLDADDKGVSLSLHDGEGLRARRLMAASTNAAARAGLEVSAAFSPLTRRDGAIANVRLRFSKAPDAPGGDKDAIFYLADNLAAFAEARDAALEGRIPEKAPISFEFHKDEIIVHAPYCPAYLMSDGEVREWSEQDRQALGQQIVARLAPHLNGAARSIKRVDVRVVPAAAQQADRAGLTAPAPSHDPIGAAAKLALDLIRGE
ncbi:MAG: hypothetical protein R3C55_11470 [Parvularculaceae bacterium]